MAEPSISYMQQSNYATNKLRAGPMKASFRTFVVGISNVAVKLLSECDPSKRSGKV